jgi:apolipoprotein N-acyltransferase
VRNLHSGMATFRAVENGTSIFRQASQGVSLATDIYGRDINRVDSFQETKTGYFANIQIVDVPTGHVRTLYPWFGDVLGKIMLLGLAGQLVGMLWKRIMG